MKTVKLSRQYVVGSAIFDELTFREPKLAQYRKHGVVAEVQRGVLVRYPEAIWGYAEDLIDKVPTGVLGELDLVDALEVEEAITGFFSEAHRRRNARASSFSASVGDQTT
jgi:hypothetical protein